MAKKVFTDESLATLIDETKAYVDNAVTEHINDKSNPHEVSLPQLGITATATEVNYTAGATSNIQEQLNVLASRIFVGTHAQYDVAYAAGQIPINCIVIFTDDEDGGNDDPESGGATTAMLGYAVLGQMKLGEN